MSCICASLSYKIIGKLFLIICIFKIWLAQYPDVHYFHSEQLRIPLSTWRKKNSWNFAEMSKIDAVKNSPVGRIHASL